MDFDSAYSAIQQSRPKDRKRLLIELISDLRANQPGDILNIVKLQTEIDMITRSQQEFSAASKVAYEEFQRNLDDLEARAETCPKDGLNELVDELQQHYAKAKELRLRRDHKDGIYDRLKLTQAKLQTGHMDHEVDLALVLDQHKDILFSELLLPKVAIGPDAELKPLPKGYSINLAQLLEMHPRVFKFDPRKNRKPEFRLQQAQYEILCYEGVTTGRDVIVEGPTGLGKTRALLAAVMPWAFEALERRIVYTTRTVTQVTNVIDELREIREQSSLDELTATIHVGIGRIIDKVECYEKTADYIELREANGINDSFCNKGCRNFRSSFRFALSGESNPHPYTPADAPIVNIGHLKDNKHQCPRGIYERATESSKIIVMPHNYLYDSFWRMRYLPDLKDIVLIVDEAHNFLSDATSSPYLVLGRRINEKRNDDDDEETADKDKDKNRLYPESRQSNTFFIESMVEKLEKRIFSRPGNSVDVEGTDLKQLFHYLKNMFYELEDIVHAHPRFNRESITSLIAENDFLDITQKLSGNFLANLQNAAALIEYAKEQILGTRGLAHKLLPSLCSYSQIVESLADVISNPYDFMLIADNDTLRFHNLHPKWNANRATKGYHSRIFTSATLSPPQEVAYLLGCNNCLTAKVEPLFDASNYKVFHVVGFNSSRKEDQNDERIVTSKEGRILESVLGSAIKAARGKNIGIFCSSNVLVSEIYPILKTIRHGEDFALLPFFRPNNKELDEMVATFKGEYAASFEFLRSIGELGELKEDFDDVEVIEAFRRYSALKNRRKTAIILGVQGGTLAEGVDYIAEQMEMVITIGLPYPSSASEIAMNNVRQNYYFMQRGDRMLGEDLAFKHDAFRKLAQSIGRAHRSKTDRAVVLCIDERLLSVKNLLDTGDGRYEYLNIHNTQKNHRLLQGPISDFRRNIVMIAPGDKAEQSEQHDLRSYISTFACGPDDFIDCAEMGKQITQFYGARK